MGNAEQPDARKSEQQPSISEEASDWLQTFVKHFELNFTQGASELSPAAQVADYQIKTVQAVFQTLIESGMSPVSIIEELQRQTQNQTEKKQRQFGLGKGKLVIKAKDDEHLEHFKDYMP